MGTYGRSFTLQREENNGLRSSAPQTGMAGPYTREPGSLGYNEICESFASGKWTIVRDPYHMAPYAFRERQWVGYDDEESIGLKALFALKMKLAGAMFWSLETDDFHGTCHGKKYPLITAVNRVFASDTQPEMPTPPPFPEKEEDDGSGGPVSSSSERPPSTPDDGSWKPVSGEGSSSSTWWPRPSTTMTSTTTRKPLEPPVPVPVLPTDWWNPISSTQTPSTTQATQPPTPSTTSSTTTTTTSTTTTTTTEAPQPSSTTQATRISTDWWESGGRNVPDTVPAVARRLDPSTTTKATPTSPSWEREGVTERTTARTPFPGWEREGTDEPSHPSTPTAPPSPSSTTWTPQSGSSEPKCTTVGAFRHPKDCRRFYRCVDMGAGYRIIKHEYTCPLNTVFDQESRLCLWAASVPECSNYYNSRSVVTPPALNEIGRNSQ